MSEIDIVYLKLKESKKYKYLCEDTLRRISGWALRRYGGKAAVKAAKNKLHQVYGAYVENLKPTGIQKLLQQIPGNPGKENLKSIALEILKSHASTSERIPFMEKFYGELFDSIGKPGSILDLGCGLHPFAVLWMELEAGTEYYASDIDTRLIDLVNAYFGYLGPGYRAGCTDLLETVPGKEAEVVFLLKILPVLEQQEKGAGQRIISAIKAKHTVISFPTRSLTGKARGMETYYHTYAEELIRRCNLEYFKMETPGEIFYVIKN